MSTSQLQVVSVLMLFHAVAYAAQRCGKCQLGAVASCAQARVARSQVRVYCGERGAHAGVSPLRRQVRSASSQAGIYCGARSSRNGKPRSWWQKSATAPW